MPLKESSVHLSQLPLFSFFGATVWEDQDDPASVSMINSHTVFGSKSISPLSVPYMKLGAFHRFDCLVSFHGDDVVQSQVDAQLRRVELWANLLHPPRGGQEVRDSEINLLARENFAEAISPFSWAVPFSSPSIYLHLPHTLLLTRIPAASECLLSALTFYPESPEAFVECVTILARKIWKNDVPQY